MMNLTNINFADILVIVIVLLILYGSFRSLFMKKKSGCSCCGNCSQCAMARFHCHSTVKTDQ